MNFREMEERLDELENRDRCESWRMFTLGFFLGFMVYVGVGCLIKWGCHAQDR